MDKNIYEDINQALNRLNTKTIDGYSKYHKYSEIYPFTNENIGGYYKKNEIEGKDILTVCSSGDHLFNAMLMDAKSVDCFDINCLSKYYMSLKMAAIECLDYEEFIKFLIKNFKICGSKFMDKKIYIKIRDALKEDTRLFWDNILRDNNTKKVKSSILFSNDQNTKKNIILCNNYLKEENYYKLKGKISKYAPVFYNLDIKNLSEELDKKYDVIYLSNIAKYIDDIFVEPSLIKYKKFILTELSKKIKEEGKIFLAYIYDYLPYDTGIEWYHQIDNYHDRKKAFDSKEFETRFFNPAYGSFLYDNNDAVIVYKKEFENRCKR